MTRWVIVYLLVALLTACEQSASPSDDYLHRLEAVLERQAVDQKPLTPLVYPALRDLSIELSQASLSVREFLSLRQCKLHSVIAHRNSSLGKVATASQRLFNDLQILQLGPECVGVLDNKALAEKLREFISSKEENLNAVLWYSLIAQQEYASFWSNESTSDYPEKLRLETIPDLNVIANFVEDVLNGQRVFTKQQTGKLERHLGNLRFGDGGALVESYLNLINNLSKANSVIQQRLESPLCLQQKPTQQAHFLKNLVNKYFIQRVQARAVRLNQRAEKLTAVLDRVEQPLLKYAHPTYAQWLAQRKQLFEQGKVITKQHVTLLQQLYAQCGLTPGA